jgi:7-keto-8-aminopelargonate synthetase-like enzyme
MASHSFHARLDTLQQNRERQGSERAFKTQTSGICFSDNDYLGLSRHERVIASAQQALRDYGTGARAARLLAGPCLEHRLLEENLAQWKGTESALLFSSGYLTPLGVVPTLVSPGDTVLMERQAHACLFDGARLSGARIRLFDRKNMSELKKNLAIVDGEISEDIKKYVANKPLYDQKAANMQAGKDRKASEKAAVPARAGAQMPAAGTGTGVVEVLPEEPQTKRIATSKRRR